MTLWFGFLCGFVPLPDDAGPKSKLDASRLVAIALRAEATWQTFPGFVADLEIECNGKVGHGRVVVEQDGRVFVESVPDAFRPWASQHLASIVGQRLPRDDVANKIWMFVNSGKAVCPTDDPFGLCQWLQNDRFQAVDVRDGKNKKRLTTLKAECNPDHKYLPAVQVLHLWNAQTLALRATETTLVTLRRFRFCPRILVWRSPPADESC